MDKLDFFQIMTTMKSLMKITKKKIFLDHLIYLINDRYFFKIFIKKKNKFGINN